MKLPPLIVVPALAAALLTTPSSNAQTTPTKLSQPAVNANNQNQANINAEATRDPRFTAAYGSSANRSRPAPAPAVSPAPVQTVPAASVRPVAAPVAVPAQQSQPVEDSRFRSAYGSSRPRGAAAPTPAPAPFVPQPGAAAAPAAVTATPVPARPADPDREQRIINFQRQNAASGNPSAQYDLGMRYLRGNGVEQDDAQAAEWLKLAAQNGNGRAKKELAALQAKSNASVTPPPAAVPAKAAETK